MWQCDCCLTHAARYCAVSCKPPPDDLLAGIASAGYEGFFVQKGSRELNFGGKPADGTAIFVRSSRFSIAARSVVQYVGEDGAPAKRHSQKGVTAVLSDKAAGGRTVIVGATHFKAKADPKAAAKRLRQVTQLLEACEALQRTHSAPAAAADGGGADAGTSGAAGAGADGEGKVPVPVIVVGDWNTDPDTPTYAHAAGHALGLRSVYGPGGADTEPAYTTWKFRSAKKAGDPPHEAKHTIDYIWHTPAALRATARWSIPTEAELRPNGLPCPWYPSDHLAIGAKFRYV